MLFRSIQWVNGVYCPEFKSFKTQTVDNLILTDILALNVEIISVILQTHLLNTVKYPLGKYCIYYSI